MQDLLLAVDDRAENLFLIEELVAEHLPGCDVVTTRDPDEGLRIAAERDIDVAILDVQMPKVDGIELCRRLKNDPATAGILVILVTAHQSMAELRARALDNGADEFISKPIAGVEFAARIRAMLRIKHAEDQLRAANALLEKRVDEGTEKLRQSEENFRAALRNSPTMAFHQNKKLRYTWVYNPPHGLAVESILGNTDESFISPEDTLRLAALKRHILEHGTRERCEARFDIDGATRYLDINLEPLRDSMDRVIGIAGMATDITERKRLEEQLTQAQKMESIGRLAGGVAHDFNNMMAVIIGYGELVMDSLPPDSHARAMLVEILNAGFRARDLTGQLLAFSRKQLLQIKVLDLHSAVQGMEKMLQRLLGEDVEIRVHQDGDAVFVKADPSQLEQVIMNLSVNSRDAMPNGGNLDICIGTILFDDSTAQALSGLQAGSYAVMTVSDTGQGMDDRTRRQIFDPFFTTKEQGKGTGLGLSTVFGIVKQHGGDITVQSAPGQGTTFTIYLPQVQQETAGISAPLGESKRGQGEVVLLVEDDDSLRELIARSLANLGYTTLKARNLEDCLDILSDGKPIDLLLTDVIMPKANGHEVYQQITALRSGIKVLFMSGYTDEIIASQGVLEEGFHFIPKPFTLAAFSMKLREVLEA